MSIDSNWLNQANSYVSWWPGDRAKQNPSPLSHNMPSVSADLQEETYAPDHVIVIEGLRRVKMQGKWGELKNNGQAFSIVRHNCSNVVSQVLKEGGERGGRLARNNLIWTPLKVKRLAYAMGGEDISWAKFLGELYAQNFLTTGDVAVLLKLLKRDERHGKTGATGNNAYYSGGRSVKSKPYLEWNGHRLGKIKDGTSFFKSGGDGTILSSGIIKKTEILIL